MIFSIWGKGAQSGVMPPHSKAAGALPAALGKDPGSDEY
jgi:hypothetical protein